MPAIGTLHQLLCTAIGERRLLEFSSKRCRRVGEPHDYGVKDGVRKLLYYQVAGQSNSAPPTGWRWAETDEISDARILDDRFAGPRPAPTARHVKWDKLFASVYQKG